MSYTETREQKTALINMGYRRMGVNHEEGYVIYGKPFANILIRADVYKERIEIYTIFSYRGKSGVYKKVSASSYAGCCYEDTVSGMIENIAFAEYELDVDKAVGCSSWPMRFNFVTGTDIVAIESEYDNA